MKFPIKSHKLTKKRKNVRLVALLLIGLCSVSCQKDLEEHPKNIVEENFYNTAEEVEAAVNAIFPPIRLGGQGIGTYNSTLECHTDYAYGRASWAQFNEFEGLNTVNMNRVGDFWGTFYLCIRNANLVIANAPNGNAISEEDINKYMAEAMFMRAWCYFHLVRDWGGVPLRIESNMEERDVPRSTEEEVYELILSDLRFAEENLPESSPQTGRPIRWAAKTLLSDVLLTLEDFAGARDLAAEVMHSNSFSLVEINNVDGFEQLFGADVVTTPEEIFHFKYNRQGQGNYFPWIVGHPSTGLHGAGGAFAQYSETTNLFYQEWNEDDLRKSLWYAVDFGMGGNTLLNRKFTDPGAPNEYGAINDFPLYRYPEVLLIFAEAESRVNGVTPEAIDALNQVHRRGYGYNSQNSSPVDFQMAQFSPDTFIDAVLQEKAYEYQFEGKRWFDLKRTGKAADIILRNKDKNIAESHYLWPIPFSELNFNNAIDPTTDQNPGY